MSALEKQIDGDHYKNLSIQPVEYAFRNKLTPLEASVVKYVSRHRNKNGAADILKAIHTLHILLELEYEEEASI